MQIEFHPEARTEFLEATSRYESHVPGLGTRFISEIDRCLKLLLQSPGIGAGFGNKLRRFPLNDGFPFSLVYAVHDHTLLVVAVAHQSRKPGFWRHRERD